MIVSENYVKEHLPRHKNDAHKGQRGRVLIIGGSVGFTGAVCMASQAALKSGAGLITAAVPLSLNHIFEIKLTEVMTLPLDDASGNFGKDAFKKAIEFGKNCDAVAIGPGAGINEGTEKIVKEFILNYNKKLILDADALNVLAKNPAILKEAKCDILITPHIGEMSRLTGKSIDEILGKREQIAIDFAKNYSVNVLLKGKDTIITDGEKVFVNPTGNNGMAKGGSGDVLTGVCASFAAQGLTCFESGIIGAYIHGLAGDIAREEFSEYAMTPCDIIECLAKVFKKIN